MKNNINNVLYIIIWLLTVHLPGILSANLLTNREKRQDNNGKFHINQNMIEFMQKFGYLDQTGPQALMFNTNTTSDVLVTALKLVQEFGGLEQTGKLDNDTLKLVKSKRCGVPDIIRKQKNGKFKRFAASSNGWNKRSLTYKIASFTSKLSRDSVKREIQKGFSKWSRYSQLKFSEVYDGNADITISFSISNHGDPFPFDGKGNVLAHAFYPTQSGSLAGDIHFDDSEDWTLNNSDDGIDFYSVAIHEMGHSLGLGHSSEPDSIMNPYYKNSQPQDIGYDDILGMHALYIARRLPEDDLQHSSSTIQSRPSVPKRPHVHWSSFSHESCTDDEHITPEYFTTYKPEITTLKNYNKDECRGNYDAISCFRGEIFVFKGNLLWRLNRPGYILPRYPVHLVRFFQVLANPDHKVVKIDAAYERPDSNIVMFNENRYYIFNGNHLIENSPRTIMDYGFPPFVNKVDAAMVHGEPPLTYLFSGEYFWIYDDRKKILLQKHRSIKEYFKGLKLPIDDVLTWKSGDTYFFSGNQYWKFNYSHNKTENGYPKIAAEFLFGCSL